MLGDDKRQCQPSVARRRTKQIGKYHHDEDLWEEVIDVLVDTLEPPFPASRSPFSMLVLLPSPSSPSDGPGAEHKATRSLTAPSTARGKKPTRRHTAVWMTRRRSPTACESSSRATWWIEPYVVTSKPGQIYGCTEPLTRAWLSTFLNRMDLSGRQPIELCLFAKS